MFGTSVEYVRSILDINIPKFGLNSEIMRTNYMLSKKKCAEIFYLKFVSLNSWRFIVGHGGIAYCRDGGIPVLPIATLGA